MLWAKHNTTPYIQTSNIDKCVRNPVETRHGTSLQSPSRALTHRGRRPFFYAEKNMYLCGCKSCGKNMPFVETHGRASLPFICILFQFSLILLYRYKKGNILCVMFPIIFNHLNDYSSAFSVASTKTRVASSLSRVYMAAWSFSIIFTVLRSSSALASSSTCSSMYQFRKLMVA